MRYRTTTPTSRHGVRKCSIADLQKHLPLTNAVEDTEIKPAKVALQA